MSLMGAGVDAVSMYEYKETCHALITYPDRFIRAMCGMASRS